MTYEQFWKKLRDSRPAGPRSRPVNQTSTKAGAYLGPTGNWTKVVSPPEFARGTQCTIFAKRLVILFDFLDWINVNWIEIEALGNPGYGSLSLFFFLFFPFSVQLDSNELDFDWLIWRAFSKSGKTPETSGGRRGLSRARLGPDRYSSLLTSKQKL